MAKLTLKQRKLVDEYIKTSNATQAAINAGYAKKNARKSASSTLEKPHVKEYLQQRLKQIEDESIMDMKEVLQRLTKHARGETTEKQVITVKKPTTIKIPKSDGTSWSQMAYEETAELAEAPLKASDQIKALELLGKTQALFTDRTDATVSMEPIKIIDDIPDTEVKGDDADG